MAQLLPPGTPLPAGAAELRQVTGGNAALWPLAAGREALLRVTVQPDNAARVDEVWSCATAGPQSLRIALGEFTTWRLGCDVLRGTAATGRAEHIVAHYAPSVRYFIRLETSDASGATRSTDLTDLLTIDGPLPSTSGGRRDAAMQAALESLPSGRDAAWRDPASGLTGKVRPIRTFKVDGGRFCREFEEDTTSAQRFDRNRRLACREAAGEWVEIEHS